MPSSGGMTRDPRGWPMPVLTFREHDTVKTAYTDTAANTTGGLSKGAYAVMIVCTSDANIKISATGANAVATTSWLLPADTVIIVGCQPDDEISAVRNTSTSGDMYTTEAD